MVTTNLFLTDSIIFVKSILVAGITDPISTKRTGDEKFILSSYPSRTAKFPMITIRHEGPEEIAPSGMRSELMWLRLPMEIRIWARTEVEKERLTQQVLNLLRTSQYDGGNALSDDEGLHDFKLLSATPVDEPDENGIAGVRSMVLHISFNFMYGS